MGRTSPWTDPWASVAAALPSEWDACNPSVHLCPGCSSKKISWMFLASHALVVFLLPLHLLCLFFLLQLGEGGHCPGHHKRVTCPCSFTGKPWPFPGCLGGQEAVTVLFQWCSTPRLCVLQGTTLGLGSGRQVASGWGEERSNGTQLCPHSGFV